jgi:calcium-dependent protein kinase
MNDNRHEKDAKDRQLKIQLVSTKQTKLGIKLDGSNPNDIVIKSIQPDGLFGEWNAGNRQMNICPGDRITSVNEYTRVKEMLKELKTYGVLDIKIQPKEGSILYDNKVTDIYEVDESPFDEGKYSCVKRAKHKSTGQRFVLKCVRKQSTSKAALEKEIADLRNLDHHNIIRVYDVFEDYLEFQLIMQSCTGGELFERILSDTAFSERQAAKVMEQLFSAVAYMHSKRVSHRDLRPENLLLEAPSDLEKCTIKIIDWRCCRSWNLGEKNVFNTVVNSHPEFTSPEILQRTTGYGPSCDLWSCGCLVYFCLAGYPPFAGETDSETRSMVRRGHYTFPDEEWKHISKEAKDLVNSLLFKDANRRITGEESCKHPWVINFGTRVTEKALREEQTNMKNYVNYNKLKKQALHAIAHRLSGEEIQELKNTFALLDSNKDGTIAFSELKRGLERLGKKDQLEELREFMEKIDVDGSKRLDFSEFIASAMDTKKNVTDDKLWEAFQVFDHDGSGAINKKELLAVLAMDEVKGMTQEQSLQALLKDCDRNGDGQIDFHEFLLMMRGETPTHTDL